MEKLLIYYSQNQNKFKTKITRKYRTPKIGYINQFDEVLIKVINCEELQVNTNRNKHLYFVLSRLYKK